MTIKNTCSKRFFTETWGTIITGVFCFFLIKRFIELYVSLILTDAAAEVLKFH